jgi:NAD(P)-dependent dehydrogenase (short-subunit alcohol dehydrogenase family)
MTHPSLFGKRVLITGAARGIGAAVAKRLHQEGALVALMGLEPEIMAQTADECGQAPWRECDVRDQDQVNRAVEELVQELGRLDVVIANAGIAKQLPVIGGQPGVFEAHVDVNLLGVFYTLRASGPHIAHPGGYALAVSSAAAAIHLPLLSAYSATKAGVEALGNTLRQELKPTGARVGVAYFAEIDTDMTSRGFGTDAGRMLTGGGTLSGVAPLSSAVEVVVNGVARRRRRVVAPFWLRPILPMRHVAQRVVELKPLPNLESALETARHEEIDFTTAQPDR